MEDVRVLLTQPGIRILSQQEMQHKSNLWKVKISITITTQIVAASGEANVPH